MPSNAPANVLSYSPRSSSGTAGRAGFASAPALETWCAEITFVGADRAAPSAAALMVTSEGAGFSFHLTSSGFDSRQILPTGLNSQDKSSARLNREVLRDLLRTQVVRVAVVERSEYLCGVFAFLSRGPAVGKVRGRSVLIFVPSWSLSEAFISSNAFGSDVLGLTAFHAPAPNVSVTDDASASSPLSIAKSFRKAISCRDPENPRASEACQLALSPPCALELDRRRHGQLYLVRYAPASPGHDQAHSLAARAINSPAAGGKDDASLKSLKAYHSKLAHENCMAGTLNMLSGGSRGFVQGERAHVITSLPEALGVAATAAETADRREMRVTEDLEVEGFLGEDQGWCNIASDGAWRDTPAASRSPVSAGHSTDGHAPIHHDVSMVETRTSRQQTPSDTHPVAGAATSLQDTCAVGVNDGSASTCTAKRQNCSSSKGRGTGRWIPTRKASPEPVETNSHVGTSSNQNPARNSLRPRTGAVKRARTEDPGPSSAVPDPRPKLKRKAYVERFLKDLAAVYAQLDKMKANAEAEAASMTG
ncbi:hypothetical protein FA95DRAFT_1577667 [Auriscalpium vulgare]|uniref:Uncharacterized protein n=1 Tax=Auriscalpium vulgare TaxID=40419 RepID=A0ACB8R5F8_9AGAM|nr:hypothetical protein FA95DRAFT_1577667 [Auriscalpium vulgare]